MYKIILTLIISTLFIACSSQKKETLKIALSPWPAYDAIIFGVEKGFFEDLDVRIVRFSTPTESFRALRDGIVDVSGFTADEVLRYAQLKRKPKMFLVLDVSNGVDAIVVKKEIKSLSDLRDKKVCIEPSALGSYMIHRAMDFTKYLKVDDFQVSTYDIGEHLESYIDGKCDAVVTYEPFRSMLIDAGAHMIFDSKKIPNEIIDVLVSEEKIINSKKEAFKKLADGWFRTIKYIEGHKKEAFSKIASYENVSYEAFESAYNSLIIPSREQNIKMLSSGRGSYNTPLKMLAKLMYEQGTIDKKINTSDLLDDSLINIDH